jgi:ribosome biogenesis GTPase / thiamine phosphate phosphatase
MEARVYKSTGSWYVLKADTGEQFQARIKGKLKIDGITSTNPVAVGDIVEVEEDIASSQFMITGIWARRNHINRVSPHNRNQQHIVAANLDQSLLFATIRSPKTSTGFIDRFLVVSEAYHVPAILVFNKADLYTEKDIERFNYVQSVYSSIGYPVHLVSVSTELGMDNLRELLSGKTTLLSGHSGVGKSSFINQLFPELQLRTSNVSDWSGKGMHTTTFAEMFDLPGGGAVIDTPGIREMGICGVEREELSHYFPEMRALLPQCQFNNCMHINEPNCAIKNAVENNGIAEERFFSYLNILDSIDSKKY